MSRASVEAIRRERGAGISEVVNDLVRRGLAPTTATTPFRQDVSRMGPPALALDDVAGLLDALDGDDRRS